MRVVSELSNGELHMDSRYVKTSGGCSAPPNRDALHLIGKTVLKLPDGVKLNAPTPADVTVVHPNDTGFELNQVTVMYIPPHFVRSIKVSYDAAARCSTPSSTSRSARTRRCASTSCRTATASCAPR